MKEVTGDLITLAKSGEFDVIAHGCNCFCTMGAGIARQIANEFPAAKDVDGRTSIGHKEKLGTVSYAVWHPPAGLGSFSVVIANCYTQFRYGGDGDLVDYDAVERCMANLASFHRGRRIGLPRIGAGLAGGDWTRVKAIIESTLEPHCNVTIVNWDKA